MQSLKEALTPVSRPSTPVPPLSSPNNGPMSIAGGGGTSSSASNSGGGSGGSATTSWPLHVSLDLSSVPAPLQTIDDGSQVDGEFIFDKLDRLYRSWAVEGLDEDQGERERDDDEPSSTAKTRSSPAMTASPDVPIRHHQSALCDTTSSLFPNIDLAAIRREVLTTLSDDEDLPSWLAETSRRVTAIASTLIEVVPVPTLDVMEHLQQDGDRRPGRQRSTTGEGQASEEQAKGKKMLRVAVGCEDGSLWMFSPPTSTRSAQFASTRDAPIPTLTLDRPSRRPTATSTDSLSALASSSTSAAGSPSSRSVPTSPPMSPTSRSRHPSISLSRGSPTAIAGFTSTARPALIQRASSSTSISALSARKRVTSPTPSLTSPLGDGIVVAPRPRKASATIGISIGAGGANDNVSIKGPSGTYTNTPLSGSLPMTRSSTANGAFRVASSSASIVSNNGPSPSSSNPKRHGRAKDSITTGIGLWETDSNATVSMHEGAAGAQVATSPTDDEGEETRWPKGEDQEGTEEELLEELKPVLKVRLGGTGEIVGTKVIEGLRFGPEEGGRALVVLRRKGHLTVHSLVDGRAFAHCDVSTKVSLESSDRQVAFLGLQTVQLADTTFAVCFGGYGIGFVAVDLDTFVPQDVVEGGTGPGGSAIIFKQGVHFIIFAAPSHASSDATPELVVRPIITTSSLNGDTSSSPYVKIEPPHSAGQLTGLRGLVRGFRNCADDLLAFDSQGVLLFTIRDQKVVPLAFESLDEIVDVSVEGYNTVLVTTRSEARIYRLEPRICEDDTSDQGLFGFTLVQKRAIEGAEWTAWIPNRQTGSTSTSEFLVARSMGVGRRALEALVVERTSSERTMQVRQLFASDELVKKPHVTCVLRVDGGQVVLGFSSGAIRLVSLCKVEAAMEAGTPGADLSGAVSVLEMVELGGRKVVLAGAVDGSAGAWNLVDWDQVGRWTLFASPVSHIAYIQSPNVTRLAHTVAFVSANSPVALVALFPPELLFILPGTKSPVESISTLEDEVLVVYEHGLARICDVKKQELRRSMDAKTAKGVLADGKWQTWFSLDDKRSITPPPPSLTDPRVTLDLRSELDEAQRLLPWSESKRTKKEAAVVETPSPAGEGPASDFSTAEAALSSGRLDSLRFLLSHLATFGLDADTDQLVLEHLGVSKPATHFASALQSSAALSFAIDNSLIAPWTTSPSMTAQRLLHIICLLRFFLNFADTERYASQAIVFYTSFLEEAVGESFEFPSLNYFADFWLDRSAEVQQSARTLFGTYLAASSDARVEALVERWQDALPSRQGDAAPLCEGADQAVLVIGLIACERFALLSPLVLKDLTTSIVSYIRDDAHPYHQSIATELCARGFGILQNYVDAMALVRDLFGLATGHNSSTPVELRLLAKHATLQVAAVNTPLFMTTLLYDILNAPSASHRNATLKFLGFMIRKKPLVLLTSLPRLAEAVVKSLDPTVTALRRTVHQAATVILNELVRTYPSIDFHGKSQRLAVGTHEGAAIIYDLKTATRMYVLEGHKRAVTAISWSPDGHRLVSVALEESKVVVWKVGIGLFSLLMPGAAPRQTTGLAAAVTTSSNSPNGTTPFKQYEFHVGDEALMTNAATLEWVTFDWPAERTVRLRIRETALNFGC